MFEIILKVFRKLDNCENETTITVEDAINLFKSNPKKYFKGYGQNADNEIYDWPKELDTYLDNFYIKVKNIPIGYIHKISISIDAKTVLIGHFAIDSQIPQARGIGKLIAKTFASELKKYDVSRIIFKEDHSEFEDKNYIAFFESLGAIEDKTHSSRRVWQWDISNISTVDRS